MVFAVLMSLLIVICISGAVFLYYSFFQRDAKSGVSSTEQTFLNPIDDMVENEKIAVVKCSAIREPQERQLQYSKQIDCRIFLEQYGKTEFCKYGCIGFGTCAAVCPEKAILINNRTAIITDKCSGCGLCVDKCPQKLIELVNVKDNKFKQCALPVDVKNENCSLGCISCKKCDAPDFKLEYCPHMCIKKSPVVVNRGFKFWEFCYNIFHRTGE